MKFERRSVGNVNATAGLRTHPEDLGGLSVGKGRGNCPSKSLIAECDNPYTILYPLTLRNNTLVSII